MSSLSLAGGAAGGAPGGGSLEAWRDLIERRCGTYFPQSRFHILRNRLDEGMREANAGTAGQYYSLMASEQGRNGWQLLLDKLINRETDFFRHQASFDCLAREILPVLAATPRNGEPVRIWSAGCATGEEAYSIAMTVAASGWPVPSGVRILGLDLCEAAIGHARRGRYSERAMRRVPLEFRRRFFRPEACGETYLAGSRLRSMVEFQTCNFVAPETGPAGQADVIVCQNVLIYFRPEPRQRVVRWLASRLTGSGILLLAPGEAIGINSEGLETVRMGDAFAVRKTIGPRAAGPNGAARPAGY